MGRVLLAVPPKLPLQVNLLIAISGEPRLTHRQPLRSGTFCGMIALHQTTTLFTHLADRFSFTALYEIKCNYKH